MSGIYHQVFVNYSYDTPEKIGLLAKHMYAKAKPVIVTEKERVIEKCVDKEKEKEKEKSDIYYPEKKDTLFWCLYIAKNGLNAYNAITQGYSNIEMEEKQKIMESIKTQPSRLKNTNVKITNVAIQEIMSDIVTNASLNVSTLIAMAVFYKARIILTKEKKFYINICPTDEYEHTLILHKNSKGDYGIDTCVTEGKIQEIETEQLRLHRYDRPLDAISNFSADELKKLSVRLHIDQTIKYKKSELYQEATRRCLW
jgi:hypothetical protein